jgi:MFS family permease
VDKDELPAVATLATLRGSVGMIVGPAIGGMLIASVGLASTYVVDLCTYAFSFVAIRVIRDLPPPEGAESPSLARLREGFRYARSRQELIGTYFVDFVAMVFGMPLALFPAISDRLGGPRVLGLLYTAPAVGALIATVTGRWTARVHRHGLGVMMAATVWGVGHRLLRDVRFPVARAHRPGRGRRRGLRERHLPPHHVEPDHSGHAPRAAWPPSRW